MGFCATNSLFLLSQNMQSAAMYKIITVLSHLQAFCFSKEKGLASLFLCLKYIDYEYSFDNGASSFTTCGK